MAPTILIFNLAHQASLEHYIEMDITPFQYTIRDKNTLQAAYMPFVKNGGLFLKGVTLSMGYPVGIILELPNDTMKYGVDGKVVWTATGANQALGFSY